MKKNNLTTNSSFSEYCQDLGINPMKQDKVVLKPTLQQSKVNHSSQSHTNHDIGELLLIGDSYSEYCNDGQKLIIKNLRNNRYSVIAEIDLHGQSSAQAINTLKQFLGSKETPNNTCLKIIHGKGNHSKNGQVLLKNLVRKYLEHYSRLVAYSAGSYFNGGDGVTLVKLKQ